MLKLLSVVNLCLASVCCSNMTFASNVEMTVDKTTWVNSIQNPEAILEILTNPQPAETPNSIRLHFTFDGTTITEIKDLVKKGANFRCIQSNPETYYSAWLVEYPPGSDNVITFTIKVHELMLMHHYR